MRQRAEGESVFIEVVRFVDQIYDEVSTAHVMGEVAEVLIPERIVAHILDQRTSVGKGVSFPQIVGARTRESLGEQGLNVVLPQQVDDFLVG